jgi:MFS family permease
MANPADRTALSPVAACLAGALSLAVAMGIGRFAFTPMLPLMIQGRQLDVAAGGWLAAANYAGYLVGALTASRLNWGPVRLSVIALLLTVVLTAAMALPLPAWAWAAMRFAAGVASAWAFVGVAIWALGTLAALNRPTWAVAVYAGVGAGIALAGLYCLAASAMGASAGSLWLQLAVLAALLLLPVVVVLLRLGGTTAPPPVKSERHAAPPAGTTGLVICYGLLGFGYILPATFLPVLARSVVSDPRLFGLAWPVFGLTAAASTFVAGWAMQRAPRLQVWAVSHLVMGIGVLLPSLWLSGISIGLSALMVGGTFMIVTMAGVQEMRARAVGDATVLVGRMTSAFALGQIAGPVASSLLLHVPGFADRGLDLALQTAAASLLLSAAWLWRQTHQVPIDKELSHAR